MNITGIKAYSNVAAATYANRSIAKNPSAANVTAATYKQQTSGAVEVNISDAAREAYRAAIELKGESK